MAWHAVARWCDANAERLAGALAAFSARLLRFTAPSGSGRVPQSLLQQALRAGTAIGAHNAEAQSAITRRHLIALRAGALREAREAQYWLT